MCVELEMWAIKPSLESTLLMENDYQVIGIDLNV